MWTGWKQRCRRRRPEGTTQLGSGRGRRGRNGSKEAPYREQKLVGGLSSNGVETAGPGEA